MSDTKQYSVGYLAAVFGVSKQTIRQWSAEFETYLSLRANPGKNRIRGYMTEDLEVFALIAQMKSLGHVYQDIHTALASGQRGEVPRPGVTSNDMMLSGEKNRAVSLRMSELEALIEEQERTIALWEERAGEAEQHLREKEEQLHLLELRLARAETTAERDREQLAMYRDQFAYQRTQYERLEEERNRLNNELMAIYRKLSSLEAQSAQSKPPSDDL